jgi:hypothetical protein
MSPEKKIKIALDENRMSIMGVQILLGFQLQAPFQKMFEAMPEALKYASLAAFGLLTVAVALLIAPSAYHRIVTSGGAEARLERSVTWLVNVALALLALAIGLDLYLVGDWVIGDAAGLLLGMGFCLIALLFWYGIELMHRGQSHPNKSLAVKDGAIKLESRIDFVLTEARVVLPGVQALFGFQLVVVLTEAFEKLPKSSALVHLAALAAVAISAVLLIAPAAHHRIVYGGEESEAFPPIAGAYLLGATVFLALGLAGDCYLIVAKVLDSTTSGIAAAAATAVLCLGLWHILPLVVRRRR